MSSWGSVLRGALQPFTMPATVTNSLWSPATYPIYIIHNLNRAHRSCIEAKHTDGAMLGCKHRWHRND
ncbi:hypothetical protein V1478_012289 [Vespula squamosa]|uniref:Uncharacterized protein n=1 Tax=Vespula squamosa TaxID=30214 RepID=A0ABD2ACR4_VESSQ